MVYGKAQKLFVFVYSTSHRTFTLKLALTSRQYVPGIIAYSISKACPRTLRHFALYVDRMGICFPSGFAKKSVARGKSDHGWRDRAKHEWDASATMFQADTQDPLGSALWPGSIGAEQPADRLSSAQRWLLGIGCGVPRGFVWPGADRMGHLSIGHALIIWHSYAYPPVVLLKKVEVM
ncbi:hypothetical protein IF2G_11064 [Cordyceps javanica]|nr:hypothetical protein IF2G_11064 [Cordyceps javanica]